MSKDLNVAVLLDFYGGILTDKQRDVIDLYYNQDLSLSEIAEHESISRQGVRDSIKRGEVMLYQYEDKLRIFETYIETLKVLQELRYSADRIKQENETYHYSVSVREEANRLLTLIDDYVKKFS